MNNLRKKTLLNIYRIARKSSKPLESRNLYGHQLTRRRPTHPSNNPSSSSNTVEAISNSIKNSQLEIEGFFPRVMCHHCRDLFLPDQVKVCQSKIGLFRKDKFTILRRVFLGMRDSISSVCGRAYCHQCLKVWYGRDSHSLNNKSKGSNSSFSCLVCNGKCVCTRCQRKENLKKMIKIFERAGGNITYIF